MTHDSAVSFATERRIHLGLAVRNVERSAAFYRTLFEQPPTKTRPGYAKFDVAEPPVNLSLNEVGGPIGPSHPVSHFGIQLKSSGDVQATADRLAAARIDIRREENVTCCFAVQNKVWATDPDGNNWEVYVVLDDEGAHHGSSAGDCCCTADAEDGSLAQRECQERAAAFALAYGSATCACATNPVG